MRVGGQRVRAHARVWGGFGGPPGPATRDPPRHGEESRTSLAVSGIAAVAIARCGFESRSAPSRPGRRRWPRRDATTIADGDGSRASKAPGERIEHPRHSHPLPPPRTLRRAQGSAVARECAHGHRHATHQPTRNYTDKLNRRQLDALGHRLIDLDLDSGSAGQVQRVQMSSGFFAYVFHVLRSSGGRSSM